MKDIILSAKDSQRFRELIDDKNAAEMAIRAAMTAAQDSMASYIKSSRMVWEHIHETYETDPKKEYKADYSYLERRYVVTQDKEA
ncbi:MAG: hypothetical protein IME93_03030 [Proteobacteria bacterium]|nr:hypothetical protein [Pseudomonadota bacterium]